MCQHGIESTLLSDTTIASTNIYEIILSYLFYLVSTTINLTVSNCTFSIFLNSSVFGSNENAGFVVNRRKRVITLNGKPSQPIIPEEQ